MAKKRLGELLLETGLLDEEGLTRALAEQRSKRGKLGEVIVSLGLATEQEIAQALSLQLGIPTIDLKNTPVEPQAIELIQEKVARKHLIIPVAIDQRDLHIAMADPLSFEAFEDVRFASGYTIKPFIAPRSDILWAIDQHYHLGSSLSTIVKDIVDERKVEVVHDSQDMEGKDLDDLRKKSEAAPVIRMVNLIVAEAVDQGASDIHVEPTKTALQIRHRVDGLLRKTMDLPKWVQGAVVSRIKIMARMDIAEKRLPQDGRIGVRVGGRSLDLRVSTIPANYGEKVVIRILDSANANIPLESIGFSPRELAKMEEIISRPAGDRPHHRAHRIGKDDHPLRDPEPDQIRRGQHHDDRRPDRVRAGGDQPGGGAGEDRPHFRRHAPVDAAAGPRHHHAGGDARPGYDHDRRSGGPHGAPGALHDPHQLLRGDDHPAARPRGTLLPDRLHDRRNRCAAPGPQDLPEVQGEGRSHGAGHPAAGDPAPTSPSIAGPDVPSAAARGTRGAPASTRS